MNTDAPDNQLVKPHFTSRPLFLESIRSNLKALTPTQTLLARVALFNPGYLGTLREKKNVPARLRGNMYPHPIQVLSLVTIAASLPGVPARSCCTLADHWFTPPTSLVLSASPLLAATLSHLAANITTPQHVSGCCLALCTLLMHLFRL